MNPTVLLSIILTLALVAMFALGLYWLRTKDQASRRRDRRSLRMQHDTGHPRQRSLVDDEIDEWESSAPYPDHAIHATHIERAGSMSDVPRASDGVMTSEVPDELHTSFREELHDALEADWHEVPVSRPVEQSTATTVTNPTHADTICRCPRCLSTRVDTRNRARKAGSTIGSVAGATGGMAAALAGAETGAAIGTIAGPVGTVFGGLAGAVIAGLLGSAAGCAAGSAVGAAIDENVLDNYQCLACGHAFSVKPD